MNPYSNLSNQAAENAAPATQGQGQATTSAEPTPMDLAFSEQKTGIALRLALEIFLQVPSLAAVEAIDEGVSAYHEAWIRGRKRVL